MFFLKMYIVISKACAQKHRIETLSQLRGGRGQKKVAVSIRFLAIFTIKTKFLTICVLPFLNLLKKIYHFS